MCKNPEKGLKNRKVVPQMKKLISLVLALTMLLTVTAAVAESQEPIKIGITCTMTGDRSLEGWYTERAVEIFTEEINAAGGVMGRPLEVVLEDSKGDSSGAVTAWKKLASDDSIVAIVGADSSNDNLAVADLALENERLTTVQGSSPTLRDACFANPWLFQLRTCDEALCYALMDYAVAQGYSKFAVLYEAESSSTDQANLFIAALAAHGIEPVVTLSFATGTKDLTAQLAQIKNAGADCIAAASFQDSAAVLLTNKEVLGMDIPVFGSNAYTDPVTIQLAGDAAEGAMAGTHWAPTTPRENGAAFAQKFEERYKEACGKSAAQIYDHLSIICEAINRAGSTEQQAIADAMRTITDFSGVMTDYDCSKNGDCGRGGLLAVVENGDISILDTIITE